jgi:hypothetical protein
MSFNRRVEVILFHGYQVRKILYTVYTVVLLSNQLLVLVVAVVVQLVLLYNQSLLSNQLLVLVVAVVVQLVLLYNQ